jgi:aflatoxin B1 aldehyde reductase
MLGVVDASATFAVSTKTPAFAAHSLSESKILANCGASLATLRQDKLDIYYLHGPGRDTPLEEQCAAIGKLYQEGKFARFGVSNISDAEVQTKYNICKRKRYPLPSVYQGGFNPIGRGAESTLIPLLRKLGMAFMLSAH